MALIKTTNVKGVEANYWIILSYNCNKLVNQTNVGLGLFKDKETRSDTLENTIDTANITLEGDDNNKASIYAKLKAPQGFLEGATDDL